MDYTDVTVPQITESYYCHLIELSAYGEYGLFGAISIWSNVIWYAVASL